MENFFFIFLNSVLIQTITLPLTNGFFCPGDVSREERHRRGVRSQGVEERRDRSGRRRRVHHDREEDPGARRKPSIPHFTSLLLPDKGNKSQQLEKIKGLRLCWKMCSR